MAITPSEFEKIWSTNASTPEYTFSDADYLEGWDFVGNLPPTRAQWNAIQKRTDEKMKYVFDNFGSPLVAPTVADMTEQNRVYVYTGSEVGYTAGDWYYYDEGTSVWVDGGVYNAVAVVTDTTLTQAGVPADAKVTGDWFNAISDNLFTDTEMQVSTTATGWRLVPTTGFCVSNPGYKLVKYSVIAGKTYKVVSDDYFQFQTVASVPTSGTSNRIGDTYGAGTLYVTAPIGATYLIISTPTSSTTAKAYESKTIDPMVFETTFTAGHYINSSGAEVSNANFSCTDYIELADVLFPIQYTLYQQTGTNVVSYYDADKTYLSGVQGSGNNTPSNGTTSYPTEARYVRFSTCVQSGGVVNPKPNLKLTKLENNKLASGSVGTTNLQDQSVTKAKCNFFIHDTNSNYIDKAGYTNGYINSSGVFVSNNGWRATDYCALEPNTQYYGGGLFGGYCAFYDEDKNVISAYGAYDFTISSFTTPIGTVYGRFSLDASYQSIDDAWIFTKNEKPKDYAWTIDGVSIDSSVDTPCDYDGHEISIFNKILCVGDSLTEGTFNHLDSGTTQYVTYSKYAYPKYLQKLTGVDVTNLGHGGQSSVQWYNTEKNNDLSGYDCAIIQLGVNDVGQYTTFGVDTQTAFTNIINKRL